MWGAVVLMATVIQTQPTSALLPLLIQPDRPRVPDLSHWTPGFPLSHAILSFTLSLIPESFPEMGSPRCGLAYHQPSSPARRFLCDPDRLLGHSSADYLHRQLHPDWSFCHSSPRGGRRGSYAEDRSDEPFRAGVAVAKVITLAAEDELRERKTCLPFAATSHFSSPHYLPLRNLPTQLLQNTAEQVRRRWSNGNCEVDVFVLLAQRTWLCNGSWEVRMSDYFKQIE